MAGKSKHTRQRLAVATQSFTPVGDLQATGISNLLYAKSVKEVLYEVRCLKSTEDMSPTY